MKRFVIPAALGVVVHLAATGVACASSPDAWDAFRADVRKKCLAAAKGWMIDVDIRVDPVGSDSYGFAALKGKDKFTGGAATRLCIYGKRSKKAELSADVDVFEVKN